MVDDDFLIEVIAKRMDDGLMPDRTVTKKKRRVIVTKAAPGLK